MLSEIQILFLNKKIKKQFFRILALTPKGLGLPYVDLLILGRLL
jgi:hypothetical protein